MSNDNSVNENKLTNEQKQKMKKYAVFALMGIICAGCIGFIFAPSAKEKQEQAAGFNADIPQPKDEGIIGDKATAYEQEQVKQKQEERMRSLSDFTAMLGGENNKQNDNDLVLLDNHLQTEKSSDGTSSASKTTAVQNSVNAYRDINRSLGNFYETPRQEPEKERLQNELDELRERLDEQERRKNAVDEQMALMEKSFQMAAKYIPANTGTATGGNASGTSSGKETIVAVGGVDVQTVSLLAGQNMSNREFIEAYSQPRNRGFITAHAESPSVVKNTIFACVHGNQTVTGGQNLRFRLLEHIRAGKVLIPRNTNVSGLAKIQGERLDITINSVEHAGQIIPVELSVYDLDGQRGIFIPDLQELSAAKEIVANMGTSAGTSINLSNDATKQFVADMGRNLIQGVSQFTAKKLREVRIHLKSGYRIYLVSETQLKNSSMPANN